MFGLIVLLTVGKLTDVQVLTPDRYRDTGVAQRLVRVTLPTGRGAILDRNGEDLAVSVPRSTVVADPTQVSDAKAEAALLADILDLDEAEVGRALRRKSRFVYVLRLASDDQIARIEKEKAAGRLDGIDLIAEYERVHPNGEETSALLGLTDIDGLGITGLEEQYDDVLQGTPGEVSYEHSSLGPIPGGERQLEPATPGDDIELTIDLPLQYAAERLVAEQVAATESLGGTAIIARPGTGEILAMVDVVRDPETDKVTTAATNRALTTVYEPGSVSKVITVAAALAQGKVDPSTVLDHPASITLGGADFTEAEALPSQLSVTDILTVSSNIGTIKLAQEVGEAGIDAAIRDFGFGRKTALDFPDESPGLLLPLQDWSGSSIGSIPIGQGISVTAMQMLGVYNTIANDGVAVPARLVGATIDPQGRRNPVEAGDTERVIPVDVARQLRGMLANVVTMGTGTKAAVPGYRVAGKTGTARKPLDEHQPGDGYMGLDGRYHYVSTFVGMLPADDPQLSIIVVLDEPGRSGSYYASDTAAPLFGRLATEAVRRLHLPPGSGPDIDAGLPELNPELRAVFAIPEPEPEPESPTAPETTSVAGDGSSPVGTTESGESSQGPPPDPPEGR